LPRDSLAMADYFIESAFSENSLRGTTCIAQLVVDVFECLLSLERIQYRSCADTLMKLPQRGRHKTRQQFRLPDEQDLQIPIAISSVVGEKTKLFEGLIAKDLSLVDDDCDPFSNAELREDPFKFSEQLKLCGRVCQVSELLKNHPQHLFKSQLRIYYVRDTRQLVVSTEHDGYQCGFAGTELTHKQSKAAGLMQQTPLQSRKCDKQSIRVQVQGYSARERYRGSRGNSVVNDGEEV
jgi:hypothetical protein